MNKRLLVVLVFAVLGLAVLTYGYTQQGQYTTENKGIQNNAIQNATHNSTVQNNNGQINVNNTLKDYGAIITQKGPKTPQKRGTSVPIYYTVTNNGKKTIYDAEVGAQEFEKYIGTLKPGQTKKYTYMQYIATDKDLKEWYEGNVKLNGPLEIGSIILTFKDDKGAFHGVRSNQIQIMLLN
jgi:hypothetical protein